MKRRTSNSTSRTPKGHHYVPRAALLVAWATSNQVWFLDKTTDKVDRTNMKNLAQENHFYKYVDHAGELQNIEADLQVLDSDVTPLFNKIREVENIGWLTPADRIVIDSFVIIQWLRSPRGKTLSAQIADVLRPIAASFPVESDVWRLANTTPEESAAATFEMIKVRNRKYFGQIFNKQWLLLRAKVGGDDFYLSDHPVSIVNQNGGNAGLEAPFVEIYLPLSPRLTLAFICPNLVKKNPQILELSQTGKPLEANIDNVISLNCGQVNGCKRWVYASSDHFAPAKSFLAANPASRVAPRLVITPS
jgi:hypothetical protein